MQQHEYGWGAIRFCQRRHRHLNFVTIWGQTYATDTCNLGSWQVYATSRGASFYSRSVIWESHFAQRQALSNCCSRSAVWHHRAVDLKLYFTSITRRECLHRNTSLCQPIVPSQRILCALWKWCLSRQGNASVCQSTKWLLRLWMRGLLSAEYGVSPARHPLAYGRLRYRCAAWAIITWSAQKVWSSKRLEIGKLYRISCVVAI